MTKQEIIEALVSGRWSHEDLKDFFAVLKDCRSQENVIAKHKFNVGDRVAFTGRKGQTVTGRVMRKCQKNLVVQFPVLASSAKYVEKG